MVASCEVQHLPSTSVAAPRQNDYHAIGNFTLKTQIQGHLMVRDGLVAFEETDEEAEQVQSDSSEEDQVNGILHTEEREHERPSASQATLPSADDQDDRLVMADVGQEEEDHEEENEDDLEERGQDVEECSSSLQSESKKRRGVLGWRKKSQQKTEYAKRFAVNHLRFVTTTISMLSLSAIEKVYHNVCLREGQEPLNRFVLARIIHQQFPEAGKCRPGSRGKQKIHYSNLQWRTASSPNQHHLKATTSSSSGDDEAGEIASKNIPLADVQREAKKPVSSVSHRDILQGQDSGKNADENLCAAKEAVARAALQPLPEDEDGDVEGCENAAKRLVQVVKGVKLQGKWDVLLKTFAHSASCNRSSCGSLCLMFRRVRRHVVSARHSCYVLRIYSVLLKLHVATCNNNNCGMTACPALRASRQMKRGRDDELEEGEAQQQQQEKIQHMTKKVNVQVNYPSFQRLRLNSPPSSLPNSQPSTPSPPDSPNQTFPTSPFRINPLMPWSLRVGDEPHSGHGGA